MAGGDRNKPGGDRNKPGAKKSGRDTPGKQAPGKKAPGDDDKELWNKVARSVAPIRKTGRLAPGGSPPGSTGDEARTARPLPKKPAPATPATPEKPKLSGPPRIGQGADRPPVTVRRGGPERLDLTAGDLPNVDKRTATKLRRGLLPIEAEIDLHGMSRDRAQAALTAFLVAHQSLGRRCALVITGKGLKEDWSHGTIRQSVPLWLNEQPLRGIVLGFATAQPKDGGSGALYVLLKRKR